LPPEVRDPHTPLFHAGKLWFTVQGANLYARLDPKTGAVDVYHMPTGHSLPYGFVVAPDGSLFIAELGTNKIGHVDAANGALNEFALPDPGARPRRLQVDPKGIVWYTDYARGYLGRLDPATGQVREFASPGGNGSGPYGIALGTDGKVYYCESGKGAIVAFDPATEKSHVVTIPTPGAIVRNMSVDSTRQIVWLALSGTQRLGKIDLSQNSAVHP
jgi:virginiamycin B lyase